MTSPAIAPAFRELFPSSVIVPSVVVEVVATEVGPVVVGVSVVVQGDPKKMSHKDYDLKSVLEVRFYFSTCVLESEFRARFI